MSIEQVKDTIRKLLNLARNDAAAEGEINNAIRFARRMMNQHNLSEEDLAENPEQSFREQMGAVGSATMQCVRVGSQSRNVSTWEKWLATFVCKFVGGPRCYTDDEDAPRRNDRGIVELGNDGEPIFTRGIVFYGIAEEVQLAASLHRELATTIASMARLRWGGCFRGPGRSYAEHFVRGLSEQIHEEDQQELIAAQSDSRAMIVINQRKALTNAKRVRAEQWLRDEYGIHLTSVGGSRQVYHYEQAARDGFADGKKTPVNVARVPRLPG